MGRARLTLLFVLVAGIGISTTTDYLSAKRKFDQIESGGVKPGSQVVIAGRELNAWVQKEMPEVAPEGVRNPEVRLGSGRATGTALIDFLKLRRAAGSPEPGWILRKLLSGEHDVSVTTRVDSGGGKATVNVEQVEISGVPVSGAALDYMIQNYVLPRYPDAKIGRPFELGHKIDRLDIRPDAVRIVMQR
jgi:hypothetical protein